MIDYNKLNSLITQRSHICNIFRLAWLKISKINPSNSQAGILRELKYIITPHRNLLVSAINSKNIKAVRKLASIRCSIHTRHLILYNLADNFYNGVFAVYKYYANQYVQILKDESKRIKSAEAKTEN